MKDTGIVRKLDNLGRLVIPKEIRRCMRIKEGSPIEFGLLPSGEIVLCKYSLVNQISDYANDFSDILSDVYNCISFICDRSQIISCNGISKKIYLNAKISNELLKLLEKNTYFLMDNQNYIPIIDGDKANYLSQLIYPIVIQGFVEGFIILADLKNNNLFKNGDLLSIKIIANFLSKQLD